MRRAMALSIDRRAFIDIISEGQGDIGAAADHPRDIVFQHALLHLADMARSTL
jgi:hypothetical protein